MNKPFAILSAVALALALTGCSGGKTDTSASAAPPSTDPSTVTAATPPAANSPATNPAPDTVKAGSLPPLAQAAPTAGTTPKSASSAPKTAKPMASASTSPSGGLVGTWKGEVTNLPSTITPQQAQMAKDQAKLAALQLKSAHQFSMGAGAQTVSGSWSISGSTLSLKMENFGGKSIEQVKQQMAKQAGANGADMANKIIAEMEKPIEFAISVDQKTLTSLPRAGEANRGTLVMHKQ